MDQTLEHLLSRLSLRRLPPPPSKLEKILSLGREPRNEEIEFILSEMEENIGELIKDQSANFFIQKLIKACDERQRLRIVFSLCKTPFSIIKVSLDPYGTRAIQKLLECVTNQQQVALLISAISPGTVLLCVDPNGHHVIQHCLMRFSDQDNENILSAISENCFRIATNKSGCCVLQYCVEHCRGEYRERILADIISRARHLAEDPFGNYVVQHLVGLKIAEILDNILRQLEGNFLLMSCNKYASNVVEKLLADSGTERSSQIIIELLQNANVALLLVHPFGNFVIQSSLLVSRGYVRTALINLVRLNAPFMQTNHYGKKVLERLNKMSMGYI